MADWWEDSEHWDNIISLGKIIIKLQNILFNGGKLLESGQLLKHLPYMMMLHATIFHKNAVVNLTDEITYQYISVWNQRNAIQTITSY